MEITNIQFSIVLLVFLQVVLVQCGQGNFFLHGPEQGDQNVTEGNDETAEVPLPDGLSFPYYGQNYTTLYIQTNGVLSFNTSIPETPKIKRLNKFPLNPRWNGQKQRNTLIAPFWADVDTTDQRGNVYYRQSQSGEDIKNATAIVTKHFPRYPIFEPVWVLIVTWRNVSFFDHDNTTTTDPRNTFQAVLITDGESSFVFLFYDDIKWTAGTLLGGDAATGMPEIPDSLDSRAIIGFNKGDGNNSFTDGFPESWISLSRRSNIKQLGTYAYQVNQDVKEAGCSNEESNIVTHPPFGSILGGERIYLYGPCWNESGSLICEFWTTGGTLDLLQNISGTIVNITTAYCVPSNFSDDGVGLVQIEVSDDGGDTFAYSGKYQIYSESTTIVMTSSSPAEGGLEGWAIAIIVIASVLAAVAIIAIIVFTIRKQKMKHDKLPQEDKDVAQDAQLNEYKDS